MWALGSISPPLNIPKGLVASALYIRDHSDPQDLIQDSLFDRFCAVAALSERKLFVARSQTRMPHNANIVEERAEMVDKLTDFQDAAELAAAARKLGIRWYLLSRGTPVKWPEEFASHPIFEMDGYKLYRF